MKSNVRVCVETSKIKQLEVEGAHAPVPNGWRRKWFCMPHFAFNNYSQSVVANAADRDMSRLTT